MRIIGQKGDQDLPRSFIAIESSEKAQKSLKIIQSELEGTGADLKTVKPENIHSTLRFLGNISEDKLEDVKKALEDTKKLGPFKIEIQGLGIFPSPSFIRVIWAGVSEGSEKMKQLREKINQSLKKINFPSEDKDFIPHFTIARVKSGKAKDKLGSIVERESETSFGKARVEEIKLKKSELTPEGPIYSDLKTVKLG